MPGARMSATPRVSTYFDGVPTHLSCARRHKNKGLEDGTLLASLTNRRSGNVREKSTIALVDDERNILNSLGMPRRPSDIRAPQPLQAARTRSKNVLPRHAPQSHVCPTDPTPRSDHPCIPHYRAVAFATSARPTTILLQPSPAPTANWVVFLSSCMRKASLALKRHLHHG